MKNRILDILPSVRVPSRYTGDELNVYRKEKYEVSVALCYPDIYEIGMSSLGVRILYGILNESDDITCERVFAPGPDMEKIMREKGLPLFSLESCRPVNEFDILGFSVSSELNYTNLLNLLDLAGIPISASERDDSHPLVIAGGSSTFNFSPLEPFIDVFIVGEGEDVFPEAARIYKEQKHKGRENALSALSSLKSAYVPLFPVTDVKKAFVKNLDESFFPVRWIVPLTDIVHDRISVEIMRGCGQGCFFCQAGSCWKPVRLKSADKIADNAFKAYKNTGYEEISLLSFSSGDHPAIQEIVERLMPRFTEKKVTVSFPSVRIDTFSFELASRLKDIKKTGLTFAPETSERLRVGIGKKIKDSELIELVSKARASGWKQIKLYFMFGLPGELEEDLMDISRLIDELSRIISIKAAFNTFVPKPHSRFERERFISFDEYELKKRIIVDRTGRGRYTKITFHPYYMSCTEAMLGRADKDFSKIIQSVWEKGGRMENWDEYFDFGLWRRSFIEAGMGINEQLAGIKEDTVLPWAKIKV